MSIRCAKCGRENSPDARQCACGWDLGRGDVAPVLDYQLQDESVAMARKSWLCPLMAWLSQIAIATVVPNARNLAPLFCFAAIAQCVLILLGLYYGCKVLSRKSPSVPPAARRAAIAGVVLSGGTILLILGFAIASTFR